jgi:ribonuclease J
VVTDASSDALAVDAVRLLTDVIAALSVEERTDPGLLRETIRVELRRFFKRRSGRRPLVLPVVMEI